MEDNRNGEFLPVQSRSTHSRKIKAIFALLAAMILVSHLSSILLLNGLIRNEEKRVQSHLAAAVNGISRLWEAGGYSLESLDTIVTPFIREDLPALWVAENRGAERWVVRRFGRADILDLVLDGAENISAVPPDSYYRVPFSSAEHEFEGKHYRSYTIARSHGDTPVVIGAVTAVPTIARLQSIAHWDLYLRGAILLLFAWFAIYSFRSIFRPYQKMRAQAERLSGTGLLPGLQSDDVEYVMETFAAAVERLTRQKDKLQSRYDRNQRRYQNLEKFNTYILNSMSAGVMILDRDGKVLRLNPSARRILALSPSEVVGRPVQEMAERFPELVAVLSAGLSDARTYRRREITVWLDEFESGERYLGITTSLIHDDEHKVVGISILLTDLTEIKHLQAELESNQRLADLGEMAAGLAHQLRNSMTAIVGFGNLLGRKMGEEHPARNTVDDVLVEAAESEQMLERFLNFARPLNFEMESCDLLEIIDAAAEAVDGYLQQRAVTIKIERPGIPPILTADPLLLRQVFVNLLQNAADATDGPGRIDVSVYSQISDHETGGDWLVRVTNCGKVIPEADRERVFQPFFTSKETGTGLGLPIARKIVSGHGGHLYVESSAAGRTVFLLRLPAKPAPESAGRLAAVPASF